MKGESIRIQNQIVSVQQGEHIYWYMQKETKFSYKATSTTATYIARSHAVVIGERPSTSLINTFRCQDPHAVCHEVDRSMFLYAAAPRPVCPFRASSRHAVLHRA